MYSEAHYNEFEVYTFFHNIFELLCHIANIVDSCYAILEGLSDQGLVCIAGLFICILVILVSTLILYACLLESEGGNLRTFSASFFFVPVLSMFYIPYRRTRI